MARTKNRGLQQSFSPSYTVRRWRLGEYIRLSKEDLKKGKDDSNSVINQRDLLNDFYQKHIGEFESVSEYVDDGHTGTDANRENFQRLLSDVMSGKINCVVVKDLSRFARNYSDAGSLIDNLFVQMGVRFISLAENVDSYLNPDSVSSIIVPITNVMNDQYCYQTSKKIRQVFDYKRRNGQYIGAFAPYGYVKHPKDKHQLIIDPDAAEIVKLIFSLFLKGTSKRELAKISRYKQSLYQDWKDGEITQQDYRDMKADYERQTIALTDVLARLNAERAELANGVKSEHPALVAFTKHQNIDQLSRELLVELIDHIKVYENGNISVRFKFADEFRRIAEYIEINTTKPAVAG